MKVGHDPVSTLEVRNFIDAVLQSATLDSIAKVTQNQYDLAWRTWLGGSAYNTVRGLGTMPFSSFAAGTTPAFGEFIARHPHRRVRVSRNDFVLTKILCHSWSRTWVPLEEDVLDQNDCVIVSQPFSGNGSLFPGWHQLMDQADKLSVPVFLDGSYFGISHGVQYDLSRPCITDFAVSLTKNLAGNSLRLGVRFTREQQDDGITAAAIGSDIFDRLGSHIALKLLEQFPHDWFVHQYRDHSFILCRKNGLTPTNVLTLGLGTSDMTQFQRGDFVRACISDELSAIDLTLLQQPSKITT